MSDKLLERRLSALECQRQCLTLHNLHGEPLLIFIDRLERISAGSDTRLHSSDGRTWLVQETPEQVIGLMSALRRQLHPLWSHALAKRLGYCIGELTWNRRCAAANLLQDRQQVAWGEAKPQRSVFDIYGKIFSRFRIFRFGGRP